MEVARSSIRKWYGEYGVRHAFRVLLTLFVVGLAFTCYVLPFSYVHWIDDVMINEFGRFPIGAHTLDWNMNWYQNRLLNSQTATPYYLGGALVEMAYRLLGETGPRMLMFTCFVLSTFVFFSYLWRKTGNRNMAALLALLYFSYPLMPVFVRGARVEAMVFLFIMLALWIFRFRPRTSWGRAVLFAAAGGGCALAGFTWITAALLAPLVLWEMLEWIRENADGRQETFCLLGAFVAGCIGAAALLLIPFYPILGQTLQVLMADFGVSASGHAKDGWMVKEFLCLFFGFPGFFAVGLTLLFFCRRLWLLAILSTLGLCVCMATNFYNSRMIYYLPVAIVGVAVFWTSCRNRMVRDGLLIVLIAMTALSYARTCLFRNMTDLYARPLRDYAAVKVCMEREIGRNCRVYNSAFTLYYVGRDLGWKQFRATGMSEIPPEELRGEFDCYICDEKAVTSDLDRQMHEMGFNSSKVLNKHVRFPSSWLGRLLYKTGRMNPILGAYRIYKRN